MTREELIARIEAGETGPELSCAIARIVRWNFDLGGETVLDQADCTKGFTNALLFLGIPDWLHSLDAAVALIIAEIERLDRNKEQHNG